MKQIHIFAVTLMLTLLLCFGFSTDSSAATIALSSKTTTVKIQESTSITLNGCSQKASIVSASTLKNAKKTKKYIYWAVKSPVTASIKATKNKITITGQKAGTTTVQAKYNGKTYTINVTVKTPDDAAVIKPVNLELPHNIPDYWKSEIEDSVSKAFARQGAGTSTIMYFTDTHWEANTQNSPSIINFLTEKLGTKFSIFGGDVITGTHKDAQSAEEEINNFYQSFNDSVNLFSTIGNHDRNNQDTKIPKSANLSIKKVYSLMLKPEEAFVKANGKTSGDLDYAYIDDKANKIRYISFYYDVAHPSVYRSATQSWVDKRVKELDKNWSVVLISHGYWNWAKLGKKCEVPSKSNTIGKHMLSLQKSSQATIAAWIVGHDHRDYTTTLTDTSGSNRLNIISVNCDAYGKSADFGGLKMTPGTNTEQAIDIISINTKDKRMYFTRVGAGKDTVLYY